MKNLVNKTEEEFVGLSYEKKRWYWRSKKIRRDIIDGYPYKEIKRALCSILKNCKNQSVDLAFSLFCKKFPKLQWWWFDRVFPYAYYVDDDKIIRYKERKRKKPYRIKTKDYKEGYQHKITNKIITTSEYSKLLYWEVGRYERVLLEGSIISFPNKKNSLYKRLRKEFLINEKKEKKISLKNSKSREYSFISKEENKIEEEKRKLAKFLERKGLSSQILYKIAS